MTGATGRWFDRLAEAIGTLAPRRVTWSLVVIFSTWVLLDVLVFRLTTGLAKPSFDAMVRARVHAAAPDPRIVIIDIDEASLARMGREFGRWPWPRDTLATVLDHIERQNPAAIAWDVLFSDADRLSPGGDSAFNEAVRRSQHSHFSVVRLPEENDAVSQITQASLPGLWVPASTAGTGGNHTPSTVALIPPALAAIEASRLGFNNGYVDPDGVLRRYRYFEFLADGSAIQSMPMSVLQRMDPQRYKDHFERAASQLDGPDALMPWRKRANSYPQVSFADVFAQAEGGTPRVAVPPFAGKVVIIGSTAPSLHDIHPTPLSAKQTGVDALATAIDNALNQRHLGELPRAVQAALAVALCISLGIWVQFKSVASLAPALLGLPVALLALSYLSLNFLPFFLDLHLAAALALVFLALLRVWSTLRRNYWCSPPPVGTEPLAIWAWQRDNGWRDAPLDRLMDAVQRHAPSCRLVVCDTSVRWPAMQRWPELARFVAVVGPHARMMQARDPLERTLQRLAQGGGELMLLDKPPDRENLAKCVLLAWSRLQNRDQNPEQDPEPSKA